MECNAFSRRPSRNASPFQFVGGAITFAGGEGLLERERERSSRKTKSEKRSRGESVVWWKKRASCSVYSVDGGGGERRIARMLDLMLKWRG